MTDATAQIGRLAMRVEGTLWCAYYALSDTMRGAIFLGSIRMESVTVSAKRKQTFMDLMRDTVADIIEEKVGERPTWGDPQRAPEHERGGSA